jgi:hypothetical protein
MHTLPSIHPDMAAFYGGVIQMSLRCRAPWATTVPYLPGPLSNIRRAALVPYRWVAPEWLALWPTIGPDNEPGWFFDHQPVIDAFAAILRTNGPRTEGFSEQDCYQAGLAEQFCDLAMLDYELAGKIMQVAVFGKVALT